MIFAHLFDFILNVSGDPRAVDGYQIMQNF